MTEHTEHFEAPVITDTEIEDFIAAGGEAPSYHPILQVWREVLKPAAEERGKKVTAAFASRIASTYNGVDYADMNDYRDRYFDKILKLASILEFEIDSDEDCLKPATPEEDVEANSHHYKNLLLQWQLQMVQWEIEWDCTDPLAAVELAALSEVHKMFFGQTGITAFLDNIKFEFDETDQADLAELLHELKDADE